MADAFVPNDHLLVQANTIRDVYNAAGVELHLFQNNYTPPATVQLIDLVDATYFGYAAVDLEAEWTAMVLDEDGVYEMETGEYNFVRTAGSGLDNIIYGWFITDGSEVMAVQKFETPIPMDEESPRFRLKIVYKHRSPPCIAVP